MLGRTILADHDARDYWFCSAAARSTPSFEAYQKLDPVAVLLALTRLVEDELTEVMPATTASRTSSTAPSGAS